MITIWKFPLEIKDEQIIAMPQYAIIRYIAVQRNEACLWVEADELNELKPRTIYMYGTGQPILRRDNYIGSFQLLEGNLVFHVYEAVS